jgi:hypothetical protein
MTTMLLHAKRLDLKHPFLNTPLSLEAEMSDVFNGVLEMMRNNCIKSASF